MGISKNSSSITISGGVYTFDEIYNYISSSSYIEKHDNYYKIKKKFYLKNNASIIDSNVTLLFTGSVLQIEKGSTLELGSISNGVISGNCSIAMSNPDFAYGFGNKTTTNSGNFKMYGGIIDIPCFWGFFEGTNVIELIECKIINGFGRVSGSTSILKNTVVMRSHGRYGGISTSGDVSVYEGMDVMSSTATNDNTFGLLRNACYYNPKYSTEVVYTNAIFQEYDTLLFMENNHLGNKATFIDCDIRGNREISGPTTDITLYEKYTYNIVLYSNDGGVINNANIVITDNLGTEVLNDITSSVGELSTQITVGTTDANNTITNYGPFSVVVTSGIKTMSYVLDISKPMIDIPVVFTEDVSGSGGSIDYNIIQQMLDNTKDQICDCANHTVIA